MYGGSGDGFTLGGGFMPILAGGILVVSQADSAKLATHTIMGVVIEFLAF
jgi:hypothetical protein